MFVLDDLVFFKRVMFNQSQRALSSDFEHTGEKKKKKTTSKRVK